MEEISWLQKVIEFLTEHSGTVVVVLAAILEVAFRLFPSDKIRSFLSYAGRLFSGLSKVLFFVSDILSKVVPDRKA